jgi:ribosomal protein S18 acetylase RimI-like enzyme
MEEFTYRSLTISDVEGAAGVISQAFEHDPLCAFMLPNKRTRVRTLRKFFHPYSEIFIKNQRGYGVGDPLNGVAFWLPPSRPEVSISIKTLGSFLPLLFTGYPVGYLRARAILKQIDLLHQHYAPSAHYYLDNIGVLPAERGKGVSSSLIRPFLARADADHVPVYTDTVTRENVPLYEHFGFICLQERPVEGTGITVWALQRPAK